MPSRNSVGVERKIEHRLFLLSVWSKGIVGLVETIGGLLWLFIPHTDWRPGVASKHLTFRARDTGFHSADPPLLLLRSRGRYDYWLGRLPDAFLLHLPRSLTGHPAHVLVLRLTRVSVRHRSAASSEYAGRNALRG